MKDQFASELKPKEVVRSVNFEKMTLRISGDNSYRDSCDILNHFYHRNGSDSVRPNTLSDHVSSVGSKIQTEMDTLSSDILSSNGFSQIESKAQAPSSFKQEIPYEPEDPCELFHESIEKYNHGKPDSSQIKDLSLIKNTETHPENVVYISIDDVGVKHQKDTRKNGGNKEGKNVENTVIHVEADGKNHVFTAVGMDKVLKQLLAWLVSTGFIYTKHLIFFSDGASNIRVALERWFSFVPYQLKLDWYHLEKHLEESLSMALVKQFRMEFQKTFFSQLWAGNIKEAKTELENLLSSKPKEKKVKNFCRLKEAVSYLERKEQYIDCYALRKELGYRNSSGPAEKSNDLIVANRQKHNGMSWSKSGSGSLAIISAIHRNGMLEKWIKGESLESFFKRTA